MKIRINQDIVEFTPENPAEKTELEALWIKMANCIGKTKRLEPMGTYIPSEDKTATFHIEGLSKEETGAVPSVRAPYAAASITSPPSSTATISASAATPHPSGRADDAGGNDA